MNNDKQLSFIDILSIMSFCLSLENLNENLSQSDKQDLQNSLSESIDKVLKEIHTHLKQQDEKIDKILEVLSNDSR